MILPMLQVEVLGPRERLPAVLDLLQAHGVLQLRPPAEHDRAGARLASPAALGEVDAGRRARLEDALHLVDRLRARLPLPSGPAPPAGAPPWPPPDRPGFAEVMARLAAGLDSLEARRTSLLEERTRVETFARLVEAVAPLGHQVDAALWPELHGLVLQHDPLALELLEAEVRRLTGGRCEVRARPLDAEQVGVLVVVPREHGRALTELLFARGVDEVRLPGALSGRGLVDGLLAVAARRRALPAEIAELDATLGALAAEAGPALDQARREAAVGLGRLEAAGQCGATRFAFVLAGWMPEERRLPVQLALAELGPELVLLARPPPRPRWGEVPVVLRNPAWSRPFERLLGLVSLPRYGSIDPTPWLALCFPLFFGLVLGDLVFGVLAAGVALWALRRGLGGAVGRDLALVALACALSAGLFGLLYGEALGELGSHLGLHPLLLDRRRALPAFLGLSVAVGVLHVGAGAALGVAAALRAGRRREALGRLGTLLLLAGGVAAAGTWLDLVPTGSLGPGLALAGAGLLAALVAEGPLALLEVVLGLGHVLSYARLMALGLASAMLAEVANGLAVALQGVAGLSLAVLLHAVNFTLCLVSPVVAALRLHYVEFFERFYEEGGEPFHPFKLPAP